MSVQIITSRHTVNRLSDFRLDMVLEKDGVLYMPASFVMAFYVGEWSCEDAYVASRLDGQTTNCEISGSVISVYFNSPGFPIGQLKCRVFDRVDNAAFTDGTLDTCTPLALPIEIVATAGDSEVITLYTDGYQPPATGIPKGDLEQSVQDTLDSVANKVDKEQGKGLSTEDFTAALKAKLEALDPYTKEQVDAAIHDAVEGLGGAVSVTTNQDGTFTIHVGDTDYTINLNHTHEGMAKLVKCTEATLPNELADDTIYVQVDDASNPTEIESLYLFGLEFTGGGVPAGTPAITKPSGTSINFGVNDGSGVSKTIEIKANSHITGDLTVGLAANSDLSFDTTNLPSGVTYNSGAGTLTIAQATAILGVNITIVYSGSGGVEIDGGLVISGGGATPKSVVVVVAEKPYVTDGLVLHLDGADATTSQWAARIGNATFAMSNVTLDANGGVVFNGSSSYGNFLNSLGLLFSNCTIETVITYDTNDNSNQMVFATNDNGGIAFSLYNGNKLICTQGTDGVVYDSTVKSGLHTFSVNAIRAYRDKTALQTSGANKWGAKDGGCFIGCREIGDMQFNGTIYQIRIYNRQLSSTEILANQDIDINKYNIV